MSTTNTKPIFFWSEKRSYDGCFSNWYQAFFVEPGTNLLFQNTEQWMMYKKAQLFNDPGIAKKILKTSNNPRMCQKLGRQVSDFNQKTWEANREKIVTDGCFLKFNQNDDLKKILLATGSRLLVEASPYDTIWGIGLKEVDAKKIPKEQWKGLNLLGICLMAVRQQLTTMNQP